MSTQVGGRFGSTTGANMLMFGGFGIPFGLIMIVFTGAELVTGNFLVFSILCLHDRSLKSVKDAAINFFVSWWGNFCGTMLIASVCAWQSGVVPTAYSELTEKPSVFATVEAMKAALGPGGTWCSDGNFVNANACFLIKSTVMRLKMDW
jgi:formate/nitrite transporter FocA (FNT family)